MASTTRKDSKKSKAKRRRSVATKSPPERAQNIQALRRDRDELLEREAATSDILRMIARSPTELQPVLDAIAERAARLCDADDAVVWRVDGEVRRHVAHFGLIPTASALGEGRVSDRGTVPGRAIVDRQTIHVHDRVEEAAEFPGTRGIALGLRPVLSTPLLRGGVAIGAIYIRRREVHPFTERQIKLLETFADKAVIAIENARLIHEQQARNRDLTEALEQQTATSEILRVIASSPTDLPPALDTVIANAVTLAGAKQGHIRQYDGELLRFVAHYNETAEKIAKLQATPTRPGLESLTGRAFLERIAKHLLDTQDESQHELLGYGVLAHRRELGMRTLLVVPLLREGTAIGTISIWRDFVELFTERQIELVKTFADQAVIAIENVRLFKELQERNAELREALEHQTATAEVLGIISRSPTD